MSHPHTYTIAQRAEAHKPIRALRHRSGMTQQQLADRVGVDRRTVASWESGAHGITLYLLECVMEACGVGWHEWADLRDGARVGMVA